MPSGKHIYGLPKGKHIFGTVKVGEKGQIVIPKEARDLFAIRPGDTLLILGDEENGILVTRPDVMNDVALGIFRNIEKDQES
ncbi:MAG: AbrB/MazE/SpoVT family DNA-binding domain-containing protein [Clostridia bacterium]|nr:AbrB/MazE/SpoVT family DNA-binding domain-containing protein [Clostridia bacterium]